MTETRRQSVADLKRAVAELIDRYDEACGRSLLALRDKVEVVRVRVIADTEVDRRELGQEKEKADQPSGSHLRPVSGETRTAPVLWAGFDGLHVAKTGVVVRYIVRAAAGRFEVYKASNLSYCGDFDALVVAMRHVENLINKSFFGVLADAPVVRTGDAR